MRLVRFITAFALCAVFVLSARAASNINQTATVRVREESTAQGDRLTLGDIAEIRASDEATAARLRTIALGYAPSVGAARTFTRERIALLISAAGFSLNSIELDAPALVIVRRAAQRVDSLLIREAVERAALPPLEAGGATARLVKLDAPQSIEVPSGKVEAQAFVVAARDALAPFAVTIEIKVDGAVVQRVSANATIEAYAPVVVAARDLPAGVRVRASDVQIEVRKLERAPSLYLRDATQLRGVATSRAVSRGEVLTQDKIAADIVIKPGDAVRIVSESGALRVSVAGEARGAGRVGDRISVVNLQSKVTLQAVVADEGLVKVIY